MVTCSSCGVEYEAADAGAGFHWQRLSFDVGEIVWRCQTGETTVELWPRPYYCDRGRWQAHVDTPSFPSGLSVNPNPFDYADGFPRYYFDIDRAKAEIEDLFRFRGYTATRPDDAPVAAGLCPSCDGVANGRFTVVARQVDAPGGPVDIVRVIDDKTD